MEKQFRRLIKKLSEVELIGLGFILGMDAKVQEEEETVFNKKDFLEDLVETFCGIGKSQRKQIIELLKGTLK